MGEKTVKIVAVAGELTGWKTTVILHDLLEEAKKLDNQVQTELIEMKEYDVEFARGLPLSYYNDDTWEVVSKISSADIVVFGSPIYQASMTGALKNLLDHFPTDALKRKVTGIITTGAIEKHFLVSEYQIKPILSYLKGLIPTRNVFVHNDSFNEINDLIDDSVIPRLTKMAKEMLHVQKTYQQ